MSTFWNFKELDQLHIELTNGCNAACPMCVRFMNSSPLTRPDLVIQQITLDKFKQWLPPSIIRKCRLILFCGVHGDPCVARDFLEICEYIATVSLHTKVEVNTNGGMRTPDWWNKVGKLFASKKDKGWNITFSIDGLAKTNHLYRRNVNWTRLMENVRAYHQHDNISTWDFLVFAHNEHEVEKARKKAKKIGFTYFIPKKALGVDNGTSLKAMGALNKQGTLDYWIHAPKNPEYRNLENPVGDEEYTHWEFDPNEYRQQKNQKTKKQHFVESVETVYGDRLKGKNFGSNDTCKIYCKSQNRREDQKVYKEVFIDCSGIVMPCCYLATHLNSTYTSTETLQVHKHMDDYGWEKFDLHKYSLKEILEQEHLDRVFADTWDKPSVAEGKTLFCSMTCGKYSSIDRIFSHESIENEGKFSTKRCDIKAFHEKNNKENE
jgi:MoaA/NifB/PqqE/SkfB family radical SAM enzyme